MAPARENLQPLGLAGQAAHLTLAAPGTQGRAQPRRRPASRCSIRDWSQVLEAAVTGLEPKQPYVLALSSISRRQRHAGAACRAS